MAGEYSSATPTIKIDEATLKRLRVEYEDMAAEFKKRAGLYAWSKIAPQPLNSSFTLRVGGPSFTEAQALVQAVEKIRTNLLERFNETYQGASGLASGLKALTDLTNLAEELNGMTATEFAGYIPTSPDTLTPTSGS